MQRLDAPIRTTAHATPSIASAVTLVSVCKPWRGRDARHQEAALRTWSRLDVPVVLCGDDPGVADACARFDFIHEPRVRTGNDLGLASPAPLLSDVMHLAARHAIGPICYVNADIIVCPDYSARLGSLLIEFGPDAFITGRRRNFSFDRFDPLAGIDPRTLLPRSNVHPSTGADFFCFRPKIFPDAIPDLVIGRTAWDNWLMWMACEHGRPAVDATETLLTFHPDHDHAAIMTEAGQPGAPRPKTHWPDAPAILHNRKLVGAKIGDLIDARWVRR